MKILITGGNGQVGFELQHSLMLHGDILIPDRNALDLTNEQAIAKYLSRHQPDLIVNAAAYTAVDKAESEIEHAQRLNAVLPQHLAHWCKAREKTLIHYSSDYVYSGTGKKQWRETSIPEPINTYGKTKLEGDQAIINSGCRYLIFRTSWIYSARRHNFMKTMLDLAKKRESLHIVNDQVGAPTSARLIAAVTAQAVRIDTAQLTFPEGIYHLAPRGQTSWHGFAEAIFEQARHLGVTLKVKEVLGISSSDYPTSASRPLNSRLDVSKLEHALNSQLPDWHSILQLTIKEYFS